MNKIETKVNKDEKCAYASINPDFYPLEAVYDAAYNFLDRAYILFDGDPEEEIKVRLKGKKDLNKKELETLAEEFFNELVNTGLRRKISKKSKNIREYIVSAALIGASQDLQNKIKQKSVESEENDDWDEDPLGIATTWEEQNKSKENN